MDKGDQKPYQEGNRAVIDKAIRNTGEAEDRNSNPVTRYINWAVVQHEWLAAEVDRLRELEGKAEQENAALRWELDHAQPCFACCNFQNNGGECQGSSRCRVETVKAYLGMVPLPERGFVWRGVTSENKGEDK